MRCGFHGFFASMKCSQCALAWGSQPVVLALRRRLGLMPLTQVALAVGAAAFFLCCLVSVGVGVYWDCLAAPVGPMWQMSAASCLPLGSLWRRRATNSALECLHVWGSRGCIMSVGDIPWVSLCVPMRPGKNSFVAPLRIRMPRAPMLRVLSPPAPPCACGFAAARPHYLAPCMSGWAACALSPVSRGLSGPYDASDHVSAALEYGCLRGLAGNQEV